MTLSLRARLQVTAVGMLSASVCLTGCASTPGEREVAPSATDLPGATYLADYPAYESLESLEESADLVVEVLLTGESRADVLEPIEPEDPTDPMQNPEYGAPPADPNAPTPPPITVTVFTAEVATVVKGEAQVGDLIEIQQLGGVSAGATYVAGQQESLSDIDAALVFLESFDGEPFSLLNPQDGLIPKEAGEFAPLPGNALSITAEDVEAYVADRS
ncbi:hypothetical protein [Arthrobacter sp. 260]|uniref:hypothetical protein n=1 Tax=Arthrobacter sp. 260 TaxID=2735314 RepID=UPI001491F08C|nr:hypothetical protein [Arthrobacter sp. 260]NOJ59936.1 hypothetical protein [Arthrobacter sp. 260]